MCGRVRRLLRDRRGGVTILLAVAMMAIMAMAALAVDVASVQVARRQLQGVADAAALAAAGQPSDAGGAARRTLAANALTAASVASLVPGRYTPDAALAPADRFAAASTTPNASRVLLVQDVPLVFGRFVTGRSGLRISATATAARIDIVAFSMGSRLASVNGGLPNALLSAVAGTDLGITAMDYNALVGARIDVLRFLRAAGTRINLSGASFGDILAATITLPQLVGALADASGDPTAAAALRAIGVRLPGTSVRLGELIDAGPYAALDRAQPDTVIAVDAFSVLRETLDLASRGRQVATPLALGLPGIAGTSLTLAIGERPVQAPWLAIAQDGTATTHTAQMRLVLDTQIAPPAGLSSLRVPIFVQLAEAQARLATVQCSRGRADPAVALDVMPAVGRAGIVDVDAASLANFSGTPQYGPAQIARAPFVTVTGQAVAVLGGTSWQRLDFSAADIAAGTTRTASTRDMLQGIGSSLASRMTLQASVAGLPINGSPVAALAAAALAPVWPTLDMLVDQVTDMLGVHLGEADVRIDGVRCGRATLVG